MKIDKKSIEILKEALTKTICYVTYTDGCFLYTKPVTQSKEFFKKSLESTDDYIDVFNLITNKTFRINLNNVLNFKYKNDFEKAKQKIEEFKTNLTDFKNKYIENLPDEILNEIIFIDKYLYKTNNTSFFKDLFFSKNLYLVKFSDFIELKSLDELRDSLIDEKTMLDKLKSKWISEISKSKESALKFIDEQISEINQTDNVAFLKSLNEIKQNIEEYDYKSEINNLNSVNEVLSTWPTLFLPAPDFTNHLNKQYKYRKL